MTEKSKAKIAVGVYVGILENNQTWNIHGKLLIERRIEESSIIPDPDNSSERVSFKGNWELPGGGVMETDAAKVPYNYLVLELEREAGEEIEMTVVVDSMPAMYPVFFKGPEGYDLAMVTPLVISWEPLQPLQREIKWVSTEELNQLAREFVPANKKQEKEGKGLMSGWGKRMHCMTLKALCFSPNERYANEAKKTLEEIQSTWQ